MLTAGVLCWWLVLVGAAPVVGMEGSDGKLSLTVRGIIEDKDGPTGIIPDDDVVVAPSRNRSAGQTGGLYHR